jgi:hypothetical protein
VNWHPDDDVPYNPEPDDDVQGLPPAPLGQRVAYEGAIVVMVHEGIWRCEHGKHESGDPSVTARRCLTRCEGGTA